MEDIEPQPISTDETTDNKSEVESDTPISAAVGKQKSLTPWKKVTKKSQFEMRETSENVDNSAAEQRENWTQRQYSESYIGHDVYKKWLSVQIAVQWKRLARVSTQQLWN